MALKVRPGARTVLGRCFYTPAGCQRRLFFAAWGCLGVRSVVLGNCGWALAPHGFPGAVLGSVWVCLGGGWLPLGGRLRACTGTLFFGVPVRLAFAGSGVVLGVGFGPLPVRVSTLFAAGWVVLLEYTQRTGPEMHFLRSVRRVRS